MGSSSWRQARGTAAVEFAICLPSLLMLMAGTLYFGLALLARLQLTQLSSEAARTCVLQQAGYAGTGAYSDCAGNTFSSLMTLYGMRPCDGGAPPTVTATASASLDGTIPPAAASQLYLLQVTASCNKSISPVINAAGTGRVPASITVQGIAGMPFVVATQAR